MSTTKNVSPELIAQIVEALRDTTAWLDGGAKGYLHLHGAKGPAVALERAALALAAYEAAVPAPSVCCGLADIGLHETDCRTVSP